MNSKYSVLLGLALLVWLIAFCSSNSYAQPHSANPKEVPCDSITVPDGAKNPKGEILDLKDGPIADVGNVGPKERSAPGYPGVFGSTKLIILVGTNTA